LFVDGEVKIYFGRIIYQRVVYMCANYFVVLWFML